jgi:hypothetical protein
MGAPHVVLTDQIVYMAQHNSDANFQPGTAEHERISVRVLRWGSPEDIACLRPLAAHCCWCASTARDDEEAVVEEKEAVAAGSAVGWLLTI